MFEDRDPSLEGSVQGLQGQLFAQLHGGEVPSESSYRTGSTGWSGASMERVETLISETRTALESQVQTLTQRVTEMSVSAPRSTAGSSEELQTVRRMLEHLLTEQKRRRELDDETVRPAATWQRDLSPLVDPRNGQQLRNQVNLDRVARRLPSANVFVPLTRDRFFEGRSFIAELSRALNSALDLDLEDATPDDRGVDPSEAMARSLLPGSSPRVADFAHATAAGVTCHPSPVGPWRTGMVPSSTETRVPGISPMEPMEVQSSPVGATGFTVTPALKQESASPLAGSSAGPSSTHPARAEVKREPRGFAPDESVNLISDDDGMESSRTASPVIVPEVTGSASEPELSVTQDSTGKETPGSDRKSKKTRKKRKK